MNIPTPVPTGGSGITRINWSALSRHTLALEFTLVGLVVLVFLGFFLPIESWYLYLRPAKKAIKTIHQRLYRQGRTWGVPPDPARTPHEFAEALSTQLERFARSQRLAPLTTAVEADVNGLTDLYTRMLFSPHLPTQEEHHQAVRTWSSIRRSLRKIRYA